LSFLPKPKWLLKDGLKSGQGNFNRIIVIAMGLKPIAITIIPRTD
jgi:hypothetical protein